MNIKKLIPWFGVVLISIIVFSTIYTVGQQVLRMSANDPQVQLAQDTASQLSAGLPSVNTVTGVVNVASSLAPFVNIYTTQGQPVAGSGYLNGAIAKVPIGVLQAADSQAYNAITWQPTNGVRIATVAVRANGYYVVSGRSLAEVEKRENQVLALSSFGWLISLLTIMCLYLLVEPNKLKKRSR